MINQKIEFTEIGFKKFEDILITMGYIKTIKIFTQMKTLNIYNYLINHKSKFHIKRDVDYVVLNNEVVIVDENTGRLVLGKKLEWWITSSS